MRKLTALAIPAVFMLSACGAGYSDCGGGGVVYVHHTTTHHVVVHHVVTHRVITYKPRVSLRKR